MNDRKRTNENEPAALPPELRETFFDCPLSPFLLGALGKVIMVNKPDVNGGFELTTAFAYAHEVDADELINWFLDNDMSNDFEVFYKLSLPVFMQMADYLGVRVVFDAQE